MKNYINTSLCTYLYPPLKTNMRFVLYPFKRRRTFIKMFKHIYAYKILGKLGKIFQINTDFHRHIRMLLS